MRFLGFTWVFFLGSILLAGRADAQAGATDVETLVAQGVALREQHRDEEAVEVFRRARTLDDSRRVQTQLGLALLASGEFVEAYDLLEGALSSDDPWVAAHRAAIERSFFSASRHVGIVEITGGEPGAELSVNGRVAGTLPLERPVHALIGRATIEVALRGFHRFATEVTVTSDQTARLRVTLVAEQSSSGAGSTDDWVLPLAIGGGLLVLAGVIVAVVVVTLPSDPALPDVEAQWMTLEARY